MENASTFQRYVYIVFFMIVSVTLMTIQSHDHIASAFSIVPFSTKLNTKQRKLYVVSTIKQGEAANHRPTRVKHTKNDINLRRNKRRAKWFQDGEKQNSGSNHATVLRDLSSQGTHEAANIAYDILTSLESSNTTRSMLNVVHYASVINAFANIGKASFAKNILDNMIQNCNIQSTSIGKDQECDANEYQYEIDGDVVIIPNSHCFGAVMKAYIKEHTILKRHERNAFHNRNKSKAKKPHLEKESGSQTQQLFSLASTCEDITQQMINLYKITGNEALKPNTVIYNKLLKAFSDEAVSYIVPKERAALISSFSSKKNELNQKARALVEKSIELVSNMESGSTTKDNIAYPKPDSYSYCTLISLLAKCAENDVEFAELAESYLNKISSCDTASYNAVILAWSNTATRKGAKRATALLEKLESLTSAEKRNEIPNEVSYFTVISAWVKSCVIGDGGYAAKRADEILQRMENRRETNSEQKRIYRPNVIAYSSIIDCWSKSGSLDGAKEAQRLLDHMEYLHSNGINTNVKPNVITYTSVLTAYARSNNVEGAHRAQDLLEHMKEMYRETKDEEIKPNVISYFAVIDSWARSNSTEGGEKAESILREMENLYYMGDENMRPDVRTYARVIASHVKSGEKSGYESAEKIVRRMEEYSKTGMKSHALAIPNVIIYNTLIHNYTRRRDSKRALKILNQMDRYNSGMQREEHKVRADYHTLNGIINSLSNGNVKGKSRKALKMLERLEKSNIDGDWALKPSTRSYNMVINTCANTSFKASEKERYEAMNIAIDVYSRLVVSNYADVDRYTFISLLKACGKLLPMNCQRRDQYVADIFQSACDEGIVDDDILYNFVRAASKELSDSLLSCISSHSTKNATAVELPKEWTCRGAKRHFK